MGKSTKYTKELLEPIVQTSISLAEVMRKLGIKWSGGQQQNIKRWIGIYQIDASHFLGQAANCGKDRKGGNQTKHWSEVLTLKPDGTRREAAFRLRRALIDSGREYKCEHCGHSGAWNSKELRLQVNHKDGNWLNNQPENLEFLCPNCHSQTNGWSGNNGGTDVISTAKQHRNWRAKRKPR